MVKRPKDIQEELKDCFSLFILVTHYHHIHPLTGIIPAASIMVFNYGIQLRYSDYLYYVILYRYSFHIFFPETAGNRKNA